MASKIIQIEKKLVKNSNKELVFSNTYTEQNIINMLFLDEDFENKREIIAKIKKKINSYKQQDVTKKKYNESLFINYDHVIDKLVESKMKCYYCRSNVIINYIYVREPIQWTLDRIDNNKGHNNDNVIIACLKCNLERRNKSSNGFKFAKQLVIKKQQ